MAVFQISIFVKCEAFILKTFWKNIIFNSYWLQSNQEICQKMRFFGIFSGLRENFWLKFQTWIVFIITYNFSIDTKLEKFHLHPFWGHFSIWMPSICRNRHMVFTKVVDDDPMNISGKFEAYILKTFRENSFLTHIDCSQNEKWPHNGWRWNFLTSSP